MPRMSRSEPGEPPFLPQRAAPGEARHAADHESGDHAAADPDRQREQGVAEQRPEGERRRHRERGSDRARAHLGRIDQEVVGDQDEAGQQREPGVVERAPARSDGLGPEEHLGGDDGEPEGRMDHRQRDLGEHLRLGRDPQGLARLVGEIAVTAVAKTCSIIHVGLWKRWRTRSARAQGAEVPARP